MNEESVRALSDAFRNGIIRGLEDDGDNRLVPEPDEILAAAKKVLEQEEKDFAVREEALLTREEITARMYNGMRKIRFPSPVDTPFCFDRYCYIGGVFFLDDVDMTLEDGLRECIRHTVNEWLMGLPGVAMAMRPKKPFKIPEIEIVRVTAPTPNQNFQHVIRRQPNA